MMAWTPYILMAIGAIAIIYAFFNVPNMKLIPLVVGAALLFLGSSSIQVDADPKPPPGPVDPDDPDPPPAPAGFALRVQQAFKQDAGSRQNAIMLGALSETMGEIIPLHKDLLKTSADVGTLWEKFRATRFKPVIEWAPKTHVVIDAEAETRGLKKYATLNGNRQAFADFYTELGKALLAYE
jgi:hypothetical protein